MDTGHTLLSSKLCLLLAGKLLVRVWAPQTGFRAVSATHSPSGLGKLLHPRPSLNFPICKMELMAVS